MVQKPPMGLCCAERETSERPIFSGGPMVKVIAELLYRSLFRGDKKWFPSFVVGSFQGLVSQIACNWQHVEVSWSGGSPKPSILMGFFDINPQFADPPFMEAHGPAPVSAFSPASSHFAPLPPQLSLHCGRDERWQKFGTKRSGDMRHASKLQLTCFDHEK